MTPQRWQQIKDVLDSALDHEPAVRSAFLTRACRDDDELRREVDAFLATESQIWDFLDSPIFSLRPRSWRQAQGRRIGAYEIEHEIGAGGMGRVFRAKRIDDFEKRVAIKLLHPGTSSEDMIQRFRVERQTLAQLEHPNIARLLDGGTTEDGLPYLVVEYVEGEPITTYCDRKALSIPARLTLFLDVCGAVQAAHQNLTVHRDLKPANILVTSEGVPKLLDFGIAKILQSGSTIASGPITSLVQRPGTPGYISPEQVQGQAITTASDVYGLGVLLYELLSGRPPYPELIYGNLEALQLVATRDPKPPSRSVATDLEVDRPGDEPLRLDAEVCARRRDLDVRRLQRALRGDLDAITLKAMQRMPSARYPSVEQLGDDVRRHLGGFPVAARSSNAVYATRRFVRRNWLGTTVVGGVFALLIAFGLRETNLRHQAETQRLRAATSSEVLKDILTGTEPNRAQGQVVTAYDLLETGAARIRAHPDLDAESRGDLLEIMGRSYRSLNELGEAERLFEESLKARRDGLGAGHPDVGNSLLSLGGLRLQQGQLDDAGTYFHRAINLYEAAGLDDTIPRMMSALQNLAITLSRQRRDEEAIAIYRRILEGRRQAATPDRKAIASAHSGLGTALLRAGAIEEATPQLERALSLRIQLFGESHLDVATTHNNLVSLYRDRGEPERALDHARRSLATRTKLLEPTQLKVHRSHNTLAVVLQDLGQLDEAIEHYRLADHGYEDQLGPRSRSLVIVRTSLASALIERGDLKEARQLLETSLDVMRADHPSHRADMASVLRHFAHLNAISGDAATATEMAHEAVTLLEQAFERHWRIADARSVLGGCLAREGQLTAARPLLEESLSDLSDLLGPNARRTREARARHRTYVVEAQPPGVVIRPGGDE